MHDRERTAEDRPQDPATPQPRRAPAPPKLDVAFKLKTQPLPWRKALGAALATGISFAIGLSFGKLDWGIMAFFGAFTSLYVNGQPYRQRAVMLFFIMLGMAAALGLASLTAWNWALTALALGLVGAAATFFTGAWRVPLPGGFIFVMVACISAALPVDPAAAGERVAFALIGGAVAWVIGMAGWVWHPFRPEQVALAAAFIKLAQFAAAIGTPHRDEAMRAAATALRETHRAVAAHPFGKRRAESYRLLLIDRKADELFLALVALSTEQERLPNTVPATLRKMAQAIRGQGPVPSFPPSHNTGQGTAWRRWDHALTGTVRMLTRKPLGVPQAHHLADRIGPAARMRRALAEDPLLRGAVLRVGIAVTAATVISRLLGDTHPYWVPLTTAAVLQGPTVATITQRTIQRAIGTTVGLGLAGLLFLIHLPVLAVVVLIMTLQVLLLLFVVKNYGIAVIFITALALTVIHAASPHPVWPLVTARFWDTLIGALIGLAAGLTLWARVASERLPDVLSETIGATGTLLHRLFEAARPQQQQDEQQRNERALHQARAHLDGSLWRLRTMFENAVNGIPRAPILDQAWPAAMALERLGYLARAATERGVRPIAGDALRELDTLLEAYQKRARGEPLLATPRVPRLPGLGSLRKELDVLGEALSRVGSGSVRSV